jgi:amino acid permease-like protein
MSLIDTILGRPLASSEAGEQRIGSAAGVPTFGLDALSSAAYGPEAALTVLLPLGAAGLTFILPITMVIVILLGIVYVSYRQTIAAYPNGGGSYTVARENLGTNASLLAAAALMTDYVLNVAVGISAGVGALISAVPSLQPYTLTLCLVILILLTFVNMRGVGEAGTLFMLPTCVFILSLGTIVFWGMLATISSGGHPHPVIFPAHLAKATEAVGAWVLLRAFASGCTAMTGVEAVSNGVQAFREPVVPAAHRTLTVIVVILMALLAVGRHYRRIEREIAAPGNLKLDNLQEPIVLVPIIEWSSIAQNALRFAMTLSSEVEVLHIESEDAANSLKLIWPLRVEEPAREAKQAVPRLTVLKSPFRYVVQPIIDYVLKIERKNPDRTIAVLLPELVERQWYQYFLHNQRARILAARLLTQGTHRIVIVNVPWYLRKRP